MARGRKDYEKMVVAVESEGFVNPHGRILMHDDFEDTPLKWTTAGTGTHFETRQANAAYNGSYGMRLAVTTPAPPATRASTIYRYIPIDVTKRLLLEYFWRVNDVTRLNYIETWIRFYDGVRYRRIEIIYDRIQGRWEYLDDLGAIVPMTGGAQVFQDEAWNELTVSVDFSVDQYIMFKSNNLEINLGRITSRNTAWVSGAYVDVQISTYSGSGTELLMDIDDIVVRELEV